MTLIECRIVATGGTVRLPMDIAERLAALGSVQLPTPKADERYRQPSPLTLADTWRNGTFVPGTPVRY